MLKSAIRNSKFAILLAALLFASCSTAEGQQLSRKIPAIGVLLPDSQAAYASYVAAFHEGLRELGYIPGKNILVEYRYADGKSDQQPKLATELVALNVEVIVVAGGTLGAAARATTAIPIVAGTAGDLVGGGYVRSLARPGGNVTGSTNVDSDLSAKRLEILKETLPKVSRIAFFSVEGNRGDQNELKETLAAAPLLGVRIQSFEVKEPGQFQSAFASMTSESAEALIITNNAFNFAHRKQLLKLAAMNRLPTMCGRAAFVEDGGLMSYAASRGDSFRRAAVYVDKILKGAKPAELPVEQPTKFELVINLKTAKQLGLTIPPNVLARADKVIK